MMFFCIPLGFVLAAQQNLDAATGIVLVASAVLGLVAAHLLPRNRTLAALGGSVAVIAAWLLPQRDDVAAAAILTFLFCVGFGAVVDIWPVRPSWGRGLFATIAAVVVVFALFVAAPQSALLVVVVIAVIAATAATVFGFLPTGKPTRRARSRTAARWSRPR